MGANANRKGASGEREFAAILADGFPDRTFMRNTYEQRWRGGSDVVGLAGFSIEVKRYASGDWYQVGWWRQVCEEAAKTDTVPVLAFRYDRKPWRVVLPAEWVMNEPLHNPIEQALVMDVEMFMELVKARDG